MKKVFLQLLFFVIVLSGCKHHSSAWHEMDEAERYLELQPDTVLCILEQIREDELCGKEENARYALMKSMALDKNYIDTTTFEVLQPAIDYYLKQGTPDEKLKTYYYQGRIFQNQHDDDNAMICFIKATEIEGGDRFVAICPSSCGSRCFVF